MTDDDPHTAETDAIVAELERAGLITVTQREDGEPIYTLTPTGEQVSRQMALAREDDAAVLLDALQGADVMNTAAGECWSKSAAQFSGHCRGVDVGITQLEQWQTPTVSVSIPVWIWLAALSVEGGRVVVGSAAAANLLLGGRRGLGGDDVGVVPAVYSAGGIRGGYPGMGPGKMTP